MPIRYQPLGIPTTSSFAEKALGAVVASNLPSTSSFAQITTDVNFIGPTGPAFITIRGSVVQITTTTTAEPTTTTTAEPTTTTTAEPTTTTTAEP